MVELRIQVPDGYYEEENRCDYLVTRERKEMWAVELDLLAKLDEVCKKYGLKYCVGAGTLLGAIRHKGFIPWDNDIDVYMLRPDYDRLMKLKKEFIKPYFLQNAYTEKYSFRPHARLRNSNTTGYSLTEEPFNINKGIFIDIFPLDGVSLDSRDNKLQSNKNSRYLYVLKKFNWVMSDEEDTQIDKRMAKKIYQIFFKFVTKEKLSRLYEQNLKKYSKRGTKIWGNRTLVFDCPKSRRPLQDWRDLIDVPFEFMTVPAPRKYDEMLRQQYGNYMRIPRNKNGSRHGKIVVCTDKSYRDLKGKGRML